MDLQKLNDSTRLDISSQKFSKRPYFYYGTNQTRVSTAATFNSARSNNQFNNYQLTQSNVDFLEKKVVSTSKDGEIKKSFRPFSTRNTSNKNQLFSQGQTEQKNNIYERLDFWKNGYYDVKVGNYIRTESSIIEEKKEKNVSSIKNKQGRFSELYIQEIIDYIFNETKERSRNDNNSERLGRLFGEFTKNYEFIKNLSLDLKKASSLLATPLEFYTKIEAHFDNTKNSPNQYLYLLSQFYLAKIYYTYKDYLKVKFKKSMKNSKKHMNLL